MADFLRLIQNENMKIYRRVRTWVMLAIVFFIPLALALGGLALDSSPNMWTYVQIDISAMGWLITTFAVVIAADIVAGEFSGGTIKLLLIRPWSRSKILLAKYIALLLFLLLFLTAFYLFSLLVNGVLFGFGGGTEVLPADGDERSPLAYITAYYGFRLIEMIVTVTMAFMISSVFRSSALAIGLSIAMMFGGNIMSAILALVDKPWVDYILFMNYGLASYLNGGTPIAGRPLAFSLAVLAGYWAIFVALSWYVFHRRDVAD